MKREIEELIYHEESVWPMVKEWLLSAQNKVEVLSNTRQSGENTLLKLQITNKSTMGAIALETGGLIIDKGWLRILGSGHEKIFGDLLSWNNLGGCHIDFQIEGALIVAYDIVGGFYAINGGVFGNALKNVFYFAPDTLEWEDTEKEYTDFIYWALSGDLDQYYKTFRWCGWEEDINKLQGSQGISVYPYLWTEQGQDIDKCSKKAVSINEIWSLENEFAK